MDYNNLGLTTSLIPVDSPLDRYRNDAVNSYEFSGNSDRGLIDNLLLGDSSINNAKIRNAYRAYTAVVSTLQGDGDTTDIQTAIDNAYDVGGGVVLIRSGTYYPTAPLTLYDNITIVGMDPFDTVIDLSGAGDVSNGGIQVLGTLVSSGNSVNLTNGDATVTGNSVDWTTDGVTAGDSLVLRGTYYNIASVTSGTALELEDNYAGRTESSVTQEIWRSIDNVVISGITVKNGATAGTAGPGIAVNCGNNVNIKNCIFETNTNGIYIQRATNMVVEDSIARNNTDDGFDIARAYSSYFMKNIAYSNGSDGFEIAQGLTGVSLYIGDCVANSNSASGFHLYVNSRAFIENCTAVSNVNHGIYLEGATYNILNGNHCSYNGVDGIHMTNRISVNSEYNIAMQNILINNGDDGMELTSGANYNNISHNTSKNNTGTSMVDSGTGNVSWDNIT